MLNLIVEIFVPVLGTDGEEGEIATGYPVTRKLIHTARHPVFPKHPGRDEGRPIEIRWRHPNANDKKWQPVRSIAWESERWDIALLEYEPPPGVSPWGAFLSDHKPEAHTKWVSVGFPRIGGKRGGAREPFDMQGSVFSTMETKDTFDIESMAGPPEEDDWKGASGSPVLVDWRILGVVVSVPDKLEGRRLRAVPIWKVLREEPAFCEKVEFTKRAARRELMLHKVKQALKPSADALAALARQLPGAVEYLQLSPADEKAEYLAKRLLDAELDQVIAACHAAHAELGASEAGKAIAEAVQLILPTVYDHGVVETVRNARGDTAAAMLTLPAHHPTVAEIIMAGVDRRETLFCPREREDDFPKGRLNLPEPPEGGFDSDGQNALAALNAHLTRKFSWEEADAFVDAVDTFMIHRFPSTRGAKRSVEQRIKLAASEIRYQANNGRTYYLIVGKPRDPDGQARLDATLRSLREAYSGLMCLALDDSFDIELADRDRYRPFLDIRRAVPGPTR